MTRWVDEPEGGRDRGARGLLRAWWEVVVRPRRFFRTGVAPGDQAPGLVFALAVVAVAAGTHLARLPGYALFLPERPVVSVLLVLALYVLLVAPLVLHLVAAVQILLGMALVPGETRAGVGETVQVIAYATAPCALAGLPFPALRVVCAAYGATLLVVGTAVRNEVPVWRAALVAAIPAALVFGYAFGGFGAGSVLVERYS